MPGLDVRARRGRAHGSRSCARSRPTPGSSVRAARGARRACPCSTTSTRSDLATLAAGLRTRRYRRGEVIFHQGDPGDALHIILSGRVKISSPSETGVEAILATLRPGEFFGSLALLDGAPRSASATAVEATETLILPRDRFRQLAQRRAGDPRPRVRGAGRASCGGSRTTSRSSTSWTSPAASPRGWRASPRSRGGRTATARSASTARSRQGELAAMVGSTRQSVNKLLGYLIDDGLIRIENATRSWSSTWPGLQRAARR